MATKFSILVDAIKTQLDLNWAGNTVTFTKGTLEGEQNDAPNRVNWRRLGGRTEPVDPSGPVPHPSAADALVEVSSAALLTDAYDVECLVWGSDQDTADIIREAVIKAAHMTLSGRSAQAGRWVDNTEGDDGAAWEKLGAAHLIDFTFRVPILKESETELALLTTHATTEDYVTKAVFDAADAAARDLTEHP